MKKTLSKRILASIIDYTLILAYAILIFIFTYLISETFNLKLTNDPTKIQFISFITLITPIIIYSYLTEKSDWKGTLGKKIVQLNVYSHRTKSDLNILIRNILKFLPWQLIHIGVHWLLFYKKEETETPMWVWGLLIVPQIIIFIYIISIVISNGRSSIYDFISKTRISSEFLNN